MDIEDQLRDSIYDHIDQVKRWDHSSFTEEEDFIDEVVDTLDDFHQGTSGQALQMKAKKMHPSPKVDFDGPDWDKNAQARDAAKWIDGKGAELADIMLVSNRYRGNAVTARRVMLSQTKFSKESNKNPWKWKIKMHQYHLLDELPVIEFVEPATGQRFDLEPENKSFTTYSFASDFHHSFFNTSDKMQDFMSSTEGVKSTTYDPTPDAPYGFQVFRGILKRFVLGMYGERFEVGDPVSAMIRHMYEHASFDRSISPNALSDGGQSGDDDPGMAVIQIDIGLENQEPEFDELDSEGPRL